MKLLFLIKTMSQPGGGAERVLATVTAELAERGHEIILVSFDPEAAEDFYPIDPRVTRVRLSIGSAERHSGAIETLRRIRALRRFVGKNDPDVAIGFMHSAFIPLGIALVGTDTPVLASEHIIFTHYRDRPLQSWLLRLGALLCDRTTVISAAVRRTYPSFVAQRMVVVTNPATPPDGTADAVGGPRKMLLSVGRLEAQKDQATLVAAFGRLAEEFPDWRLRIIGEGELRPNLEAQVAALGLEDRVSLPGATRNIAAEYRRAQLFVLPSSYESFGLVTAEALSYGLPAIGFADCPGTSELIQDRVNGLLAAGPERVKALAEAMRILLESSDLRRRYGAAAPPSVSQFAIGPVADRWEEVLRALAYSKTGASR